MFDYSDITNAQIKEAIDSYIHSERDRIILTMNLVDGYTYQQISDCLYALDQENKAKGIYTKYELTPRQVSNIILKQEKIVFKHLS
jgi:uncharacterized protein (DUF433 family)